MRTIPTDEGRRPDIIKFSFGGGVGLDEDLSKIAFAKLGLGGEAVANCSVVFAGYGFSKKKDDELVLTVKLMVADFSEDRSGLAPEDEADEDDDEGGYEDEQTHGEAADHEADLVHAT